MLMKKSKQVTYHLFMILTVCLLFLTSPSFAQMIKGFPIDDEKDFGADCEIISATVTSKFSKEVYAWEFLFVILWPYFVLSTSFFPDIFSHFIVVNCPKQDTYDVILTEALTKGTGKISEIENDINDQGEQVIRRITEINVKVVMVKQSNELKFPGALFVLTRESSEGSKTIYKVYRYWQDLHQTSVDWI